MSEDTSKTTYLYLMALYFMADIGSAGSPATLRLAEPTSALQKEMHVQPITTGGKSEQAPGTVV